MFRLIGLIVVALIIVALIGWYRGWFVVQSTHQDGVRQVDVTVDRTKIDQDKEKLRLDLHPSTTQRVETQPQ